MIGLLVSAAMVSLPTAAEPAEKIRSFYNAHGQIIVWQQVIGALSLVPFIAFALALNSRSPSRWLIPATLLLAAVQLVTNVVPLIIELTSDVTPESARSLTRVEDLADAALFVTVALFVVAATLREPSWVRALAIVVAVASLIRAIASPLGVTALDFAAPLAFVAFVLLLSVRMLAGSAPAKRPATTLR